MSDEYSKNVVIQALSEMGLEAETVPPQDNQKTPDIRAWHKNEHYFFELKIKSDNLEELKQEREVLKRGEIAEKHTPTGIRNTLFGVISDSVEQMACFDYGHNVFHISWLHSSGRYDELLNMRFHATLFGTQDLFSVERKGLITCYYFNESSFFSHRNELDGVILTYQNKLQLCVNTLSPNYSDFTKSFLYKTLSKGLCDPVSQKDREGVFIADCDIDRRDEKGVIDFLCMKYGLRHLQTINMEYHSAKIALPDKQANL